MGKFMHVTWLDYDKDKNCLYYTEDIMETGPSFRSVFKIDNRTGSRANKMILTFKVYYTTYKVLIQGKFCQTWLSNEFERLQNFVNPINCRNSTLDQGPPLLDFELRVDLPKSNAQPTCRPRVRA
jgi:hypothetical protein